MNIVLLGSPASGKGTQADLLCRKFGLYHLSTGDISRELAKKDTRIKEIIDSGKLIPQEEMTMYVINFLTKEKKNLKNILFEGFPRFIPQYEALEEFLKTNGDDIDVVFSLDVSREEAIRRISARRTCQKCGKVYNLITNPPKVPDTCECGGKLILRKDDEPEGVRVRFEYYKENTEKLINYLDKKGKLVRVNGERPIAKIQKDLVKCINSI
jgi:adenylate kinase